jgi:glucosamine kinase
MNSIATAISSSSGTVERTPVGIGIDGGGSNCRAWVFNARGQVLGQGQSGPANPVSGLTESFDAITTAAEKAVQDGGFPPSILAQLPLAIGLAGLHLPQFYQQFQQWQHPFASLHLTTDLQIAAYGVHQHQDGALIILGTGFSALASIGDKRIELGGYGFPINCTASGSWFGLEAVKAVLLARDGLAPATVLTELLPDAQTSASLASQYLGQGPAVYARLAPIVLQAAQQQDSVALRIRSEAVSFVNQVINRLLEVGAPSVGLVGSIAAQLMPFLDSATPCQFVANAGERGSWSFLQTVLPEDAVPQRIFATKNVGDIS